MTSLEDGETAPALDSFDEQNVKEVTTKTEDLSFIDANIHLSQFEMHQFSGEGTNWINCSLSLYEGQIYYPNLTGIALILESV